MNHQRRSSAKSLVLLAFSYQLASCLVACTEDENIKPNPQQDTGISSFSLDEESTGALEQLDPEGTPAANGEDSQKPGVDSPMGLSRLSHQLSCTGFLDPAKEKFARGQSSAADIS